MTQWEYCEVDFDGAITYVYFYDEAGKYIDNPTKHPRLGVELAKLGHDGWEIISSWWRDNKRVTYMLKRPLGQAWTETQSKLAEEEYFKQHPKDVKYLK